MKYLVITLQRYNELYNFHQEDIVDEADLNQVLSELELELEDNLETSALLISYTAIKE